MNSDHQPIPLILKFDDWPAQDRGAWASLFTSSTFFGDGGACTLVGRYARDSPAGLRTVAILRPANRP